MKRLLENHKTIQKIFIIGKFMEYEFITNIFQRIINSYEMELHMKYQIISYILLGRRNFQLAEFP